MLESGLKDLAGHATLLFQERELTDLSGIRGGLERRCDVFDVKVPITKSALPLLSEIPCTVVSIALLEGLTCFVLD